MYIVLRPTPDIILPGFLIVLSKRILKHLVVDPKSRGHWKVSYCSPRTGPFKTILLGVMLAW